MSQEKKEIQFSQDVTGVHSISNAVKGVVTDEIEIDTNKLTIADMRVVFNGLASVIKSLSSAMYKFEEKV